MVIRDKSKTVKKIDSGRLDKQEMTHHVREADVATDVSHRWAVILAGGDGKRLLPLTKRLSGDERPKQYCSVVGEESLLDQTRDRVARVVNPDRTILAVTKAHEHYYSKYRTGRRAGLLIQPCNRGTCPAVLYSLLRLREEDPSAVVGFFPSNHHFTDDEAFASCLNQAFEATELHSDSVILLGCHPDRPETEFGWIEPGERLRGGAPDPLCRVRHFWEKPSKALAVELMDRGCFWNSFIMVGRIRAFLNLIGRGAPFLFQSIQAIAPSLFTTREEAAMRDLYLGITSRSFCADVLSSCPGNLAVQCNRSLDWSDVGEVDRALAVMDQKGVAMPAATEEEKSKITAA